MYVVYLVLLVLVILYVASYYRYPKFVSILQTSLSKFSPDLLLEKQPVVIDNNDCDLEEIQSRWFAVNFTTPYTLSASDTWHTNKFKYNVIQGIAGSAGAVGADANAEVFLCNPNTLLGMDGAPIQDPATQIVGLHLAEGQILIIPFHWYYMISGSGVKCLGVNDLITSIVH